MVDRQVSEQQMNEIHAAKAKAGQYFPDCKFSDDLTALETLNGDEVFIAKERILPYLQTLFFEEHLVEVQPSKTTRVFFAQLIDELPDLMEEDIDGEIVIVEPDYEPGSYLKSGNSFLLSPLTPGIGNAQVRNARHILIRFFSGTQAIELGCSFREQAAIRDQPALRFNYPEIGRVNRNFRSYRVKAGSTLDAKVGIRSTSPDAVSEILYQLYDVSSGGVAFELTDEQPQLQVGQTIQCSLMVPGGKDLLVNGTVRSVNKVREKKGYKTVCGVKIDLETRALAADIEQLAALVQRLQLREMAEKTDDLEGVTIIR